MTFQVRIDILHLCKIKDYSANGTAIFERGQRQSQKVSGTLPT